MLLDYHALIWGEQEAANTVTATFGVTVASGTGTVINPAAVVGGGAGARRRPVRRLVQPVMGRVVAIVTPAITRIEATVRNVPAVRGHVVSVVGAPVSEVIASVRAVPAVLGTVLAGFSEVSAESKGTVRPVPSVRGNVVWMALSVGVSALGTVDRSHWNQLEEEDELILLLFDEAA
jgi:hypothetical protein